MSLERSGVSRQEAMCRGGRKAMYGPGERILGSWLWWHSGFLWLRNKPPQTLMASDNGSVTLMFLRVRSSERAWQGCLSLPHSV